MKYNSAVNYRIQDTHKESLQEWANKEGISLSQLLVILTTCEGPEALVNKVLSDYIPKVQTRLSLTQSLPIN
jgi:hypothetical protein